MFHLIDLISSFLNLIYYSITLLFNHFYLFYFVNYCSFYFLFHIVFIHQEWQVTDPSKTVFHWDLMQQANAEKLLHSTKETILSEGQVASDMRETLMFWINQVPLDAVPCHSILCCMI